MKVLTLDSIRFAAENLLLENGQITSLEVKQELRRLNYIANQSEVSFGLGILAIENGWHHYFNGKFKSYRLSFDCSLAIAVLEEQIKDL